MSIVECIEACLDVANSVTHELSGEAEKKKTDRLAWLERQVLSIVAQLQAILAEIDAGMSVAEMGFFGDDDLLELIAEMEASLRNLRGQIRSLRGVER